jgi:signal transduction histidine kinase
MPTNSELNTFLTVLALSDAMKAAVAQGVPTCKYLEDIFLELAANKAKVEAMLQHTIDESIISDIDIHRIMLVFDWCMMNIVDPNFACSNFT